MRYQVLTAASMKMTVFWDIAPCRLAEIDRHFRGAYCLHHQGALTYVYIYYIIWFCSPSRALASPYGVS
jgi:hypothetical protein